MDFGVTVFPTATSMPLVDLGRDAEDAGFESLLLPEHTHIPVKRESLWRGQVDVPPHYLHLLDPLIALAALAVKTSRIRLGTAVLLVAQRDPIVLAKQLATLDVLSGGRVVLGVGAGWNLEEMRNHAVDPSRRWAIAREKVLAIRRMWVEDEPEYHGKDVEFDRIWLYPKPVQQPHPPVLIGGNSKRSLERVLDYGSGWMPIDRTDQPLTEASISDRIDELRRLATARGLPRPSVTIHTAPQDPRALEAYALAGADRCVFLLPTADARDTRAEIRRLAALAKSLL